MPEELLNTLEVMRPFMQEARSRVAKNMKTMRAKTALDSCSIHRRIEYLFSKELSFC
jgi:hypothetical protein